MSRLLKGSHAGDTPLNEPLRQQGKVSHGVYFTTLIHFLHLIFLCQRMEYYCHFKGLCFLCHS